MGIMDAIATFGIGAGGYEEMDEKLRRGKRERSAQKITDMAVADALRKDELAQGAREAMKAVKKRPAMYGLEIPEHQGEAYDEEYRPAKKEGLDLPEDVDRRGQTKAAADFYSEKGELEQSEKFRKALEAMEAEGYKDIVVGVATGKTPQEIATHFNRIGEKRIVDGSTDGKVYRFKYEDGTEGTYDREQTANLATRLGLLKKPETRIVAPGAAVVDEAGKQLFKNPDRPRNIDPLSPEGIQQRQGFEKWKADNGFGLGGRGTPAKILEVNSLVKEFGMDPDQALEMAYGINRNAKTREQRVLAWVNALKHDVNLGMDQQALMAAAERMAKAFDDDGGATRPSPRARRKTGSQPTATPGNVLDSAGMTQADLDALPSGSRVRGPDGSIYRVP